MNDLEDFDIDEVLDTVFDYDVIQENMEFIPKDVWEQLARNYSINSINPSDE